MGIWDFLRPAEKQPKRRMQQRNYAAANQGRLFADFKGSNRSADSEMRPALVLMRDRSRDLARNDPYARRFLSLVRTNAVGETGLSLQVKARNGDGSLDVIGNDQIERTWYDWGRSCTVDGKMTWTDVQQYVSVFVAYSVTAIQTVIQKVHRGGQVDAMR